MTFGPGSDHDSKFKILVADDDTTIRSTLAEAVRAWGYHTIEAATLAETLVVVDREHPHGLLLDVKLPDGSGIYALDALRRRSPELVIIITGYVTPNLATASRTFPASRSCGSSGVWTPMTTSPCAAYFSAQART